MARLVVFTALESALLDPRTGSPQAARPGLEQLRRRGIPVVICTGQTRAEVLPLREELGLRDPFVAEHGGAIYIPRNYFPFALPTARVETGYQVLELGVPYQKLVRALDEAAKTSGVKVLGFSHMTDKEVAKLCDLAAAAAKRARQREFDEPFLLEQGTAQQKERFFRWLQQRGLRWRQDGDFLHLMGDNDKGVAVTRLTELYLQQFSQIRTVGLGSGPGDLDLLAGVELPILLAKPDGSHDAEVRRKLPRAHLAPGAGPAGLNDAVAQILALPR